MTRRAEEMPDSGQGLLLEPPPADDDVEAALPVARRRSRWRAMLPVIVVLAAAVGLAAAVRAADRDLLGALLEGHGSLLVVVSLVANCCGLFLGMASWRALADGLGKPLRRLAAWRVFFYGLLSKFLPGPVWGLLVHVQLGRKAGATTRQIATAYGLSLGTALASGLTVGALVAPEVLGGNSWWLLLPLTVFGALLFRPNLVNIALEAGSRLLRRRLITDHVPDGRMRRSLVYGVLSWVVGGLHVWALAVALGAPPLAALHVCVGGFALATAVGGLTLVLPDGLGVREAVLVLALGTVMPWPEATAVAVASRLVCTIAEAGVGGVVAFATRKQGR